ncbi:MAG TPA: lysylphosphatidylglycerol synthase transmembrane domain-containing protein [Chloroflexia bacterium]|nr:lysylphosphatidylglycerol synthase transmembrane domain-containing protein [Chloroflexia bacterium]
MSTTSLHLRPARAALPATELALGRRLRDGKTLAGFAVSAAIVVLFLLTAHLNLATIWATVQTADVRTLALALGIYLGAFVLRGLRWRLLLRQADLGPDVRLPALGRLIEIIYLSWFINCLVPAKLGDGYRAHLLRQETGADLGHTLGTVVGERLADILALVVLLGASGLLILSSLAGASRDLTLIVLLGAGLGAAIVGGVVALRLLAGRLTGWLPARWRAVFAHFVAGTLRTFRRDVQLPLYGLTALIWAAEALRIGLVLWSFHITGLAPGVILFTALAGSLLSTIPFTPAGLGAVEGASVAILTAFGVATSLAGAVAVVDRVINYWSNLPIGALLYLLRRRRDRRDPVLSAH